jgi:hypothetical protein
VGGAPGYELILTAAADAILPLFQTQLVATEAAAAEGKILLLLLLLLKHEIAERDPTCHRHCHRHLLKKNLFQKEVV